MDMAMAAIITVATAGTMSTRQASPTKRLVAGAALLIGVLLFGLSIPRVIAYSHVAQAPVGVIEALDKGRPISKENLAEAGRLYSRALSFLPSDARFNQDAGRIAIRRAENFEETAEAKKSAWQTASSYFQNSIQSAPARHFPWSLEAAARAALTDDPQNISEFMRISYYLAPQTGSSILLRASLGTRYWQALPEDVQGNTKQDLEKLWQIRPLRSSLVNYYLAAELPVRIVIRSLIPQKDRALFDRMLIKASGLSARG